MATQQRRQLSVLGASTLAFTICFAVWVMFSIIGIPIKERLGLSETQFGLLAAIPTILFGVLVDLTGVRSSAFMLLFVATTISVIWLHAGQRSSEGVSHGFARIDVLES